MNRNNSKKKKERETLECITGNECKINTNKKLVCFQLFSAAAEPPSHHKWMTDVRQSNEKTILQFAQSHSQHVILWAPGLTWSQRGDSGRVSVRCILVRWVSSLLIPSLFPTHNKARSWPGLAQRPCLSDLWHNTNLCPPWRGASLRHRLLLWEGLVFGHRDDNWDVREGVGAVI